MGNKSQIQFCLERLAWTFSEQMHLKDMIDQSHLLRFSFTVSRDAFRLPEPSGRPSDVKRTMILLDFSLQRKIWFMCGILNSTSFLFLEKPHLVIVIPL